jgi:hypothetical protein
VEEWKAAGEDKIANEMVKSGGSATVKCLIRLVNLCMNTDNTPEDNTIAEVQ